MFAEIHHHCKHAVTCQYWAGTRPMLTASALYRPSSGMFTGITAHIYTANLRCLAGFVWTYMRYGFPTLNTYT